MGERLRIFFKLKLEEIYNAIKFFVIVFIVLMVFAVILTTVMSGLKWFGNSYPKTAHTTIYIFGFLFLGIVIFGLITIIYQWGKDNWKKAGELCEKKGS